MQIGTYVYIFVFVYTFVHGTGAWQYLRLITLTIGGKTLRANARLVASFLFVLLMRTPGALQPKTAFKLIRKQSTVNGKALRRRRGRVIVLINRCSTARRELAGSVRARGWRDVTAVWIEAVDARLIVKHRVTRAVAPARVEPETLAGDVAAFVRVVEAAGAHEAGVEVCCDVTHDEEHVRLCYGGQIVEAGLEARVQRQLPRVVLQLPGVVVTARLYHDVTLYQIIGDFRFYLNQVFIVCGGQWVINQKAIGINQHASESGNSLRNKPWLLMQVETSENDRYFMEVPRFKLQVKPRKARHYRRFGSAQLRTCCMSSVRTNDASTFMPVTPIARSFDVCALVLQVADVNVTSQFQCAQVNGK